jgi:GMP synthase (glutamine-hydrolysing)
MKTALALRHVHCEHLGALEPALRELGYIVRYLEAPTASLEGHSPDLLIVLGGPISVNDGADYPFLKAEQALVTQQLERRKPLLGICLGAQMLARTLGARVYSMGKKEIGWSPLEPTLAGNRSPVRHLLTPGLDVLHFHGETFELPPDATCLASTATCRNQAFSIGDHALGLQFHPEVTAEQLQSWYVAHTAELSSARIDVNQLRQQGEQKAPRLSKPLQRFVSDWLQRADEQADAASVSQMAP